MSERKEGWYHTKLDGVWGCCEYYNGEWVVLDKAFTDHWFDEIGPRIPSPDELQGWKLVPVEPDYSMLSSEGCSNHGPDEYCIHHEGRKRIWAAMLAAAPKPGDEQ